MGTVTTLANEVIKRMESEGKVVTLTFSETAAIDNRLAEELKKIKSDFEVKERNSRAYVAQLELKSLNI